VGGSSAPTQHPTDAQVATLHAVLQVLVDADNVSARRLQPVLALLDTVTDRVRLTASGRPKTLSALHWPGDTRLLPHTGWQRADVALAEAYSPGDEPLILVTGDGDFGLLAARHSGAVLVISGAPSSRLRDSGTVVDPATEGVEPIRAWLSANGISGAGWPTSG
jgi:hypothetical protein